jgi:organic radical activating enzyme
MRLNLSRTYRLPVSKNDNFNAWIEITTCCNIRCPGCYRGCDRPDHRGRHKPLDEIRAEIEELVRLRNPSMLSISGGEALLHPDLEEVVEFARGRGLAPVLFTNGLLLVDSRLARLRACGLAAVVVRVDTLQEENRALAESDLSERRESLARLADRHGLFLVLTSCIDRANLDQIPSLLEWGRHNADKVGQHLLILKRGLVLSPSDPPEPEGIVHMTEFVEALEASSPEMRFSAWLGSDRAAQDAKWLQAMRLVVGGVELGWTDPRFVEAVQSLAHWFTGRYVGLRGRESQILSLPTVMLLAIFFRCFRTPLRRWLARPALWFRRARIQAITIVAPPHLVDGRRDLCDGCPDAILHDGRLVPSCALAEIELYGHPYEET